MNGYYNDNDPRNRRLDDSEFSQSRRQARHGGLRDEDWIEDHDHPSNYRYERDRGGAPARNRAADYDPEDDYYEAPRRPRRPAQRQERPQPRDHRTDDNERHMDKPLSFRKRHPILMNLIYIVLTGILACWIVMWFLDYWTFHGQERAVPDVKGQNYNVALANIEHSGLRPVVSDSVFDSFSSPGTVVEQSPKPNERIKKGGSVYLSIVAFSPKMVTVPDFYNVSVRQARSMFEGLGIKSVREVTVPSEYEGLVLGAMFNGVQLNPGAKIPLSAIVTLQVGQGADPYEDMDSVDAVFPEEIAVEELNIE